MGTGSALRELARFLDDCERSGAVESVALADCADPTGAGELTATLDVALSTGSPEDEPTGTETISLRTAGVDADGRLRFALESAGSVVPVADHDVEVEPTDASIEPDGTVTVSLSASVTDDGPAAADSAGSGSTDGADAVAADRSTDGGVVPAGDASDDGAIADEHSGSTAVEDAPREAGASGPAVTGSDESAAGASDEPTSGTVPWRDRGVPPFRDPDLLADVYDSCDTFAEMTDALGMDVSPETVRRYMIDHGIHEPDSYDTGSEGTGDGQTGDGDTGDEDASDADGEAGGGNGNGDGDDRRGAPAPAPSDGSSPGVEGRPEPTAGDGESESESGSGSPVVLADGIGLPDDVTVERLIATVESSNTVYEVRRDVGVDREDALDMLRELDLLDLVVGRLATEAERDISRGEIVERLRRTAAQ